MTTLETMTPDELEMLKRRTVDLLNRKAQALYIKNLNLRALTQVGIRFLGSDEAVHVSDAPLIAKIIGAPVISEPWQGNASCQTNYTCYYFMYKGVKFFSLKTECE